MATRVKTVAFFDERLNFTDDAVYIARLNSLLNVARV